MKLRLSSLAAALALLAAPAAHAAGWKQLTASGGSNIDQVGAVRTTDGVLHVAWKKDGDIFHTAIGPDGKIGATSPIVSRAGRARATRRWSSVRGGLRAIWGGIRTTEADRAQPGPQHRVLLRQRRDVDAAAGLDRPDRRAGLRERHERDDAGEREHAAVVVRDRSARGCTPGSIRRRRTSTTRRRSAATATIPGPRRRRRRRRDAGLVLGLAGPAGILAQARQRGRLAGRRAADDAGHDGDGRRAVALAHADRRAAQERRLLHRQRASATRRRTRSASGASGRARRRCWTRPTLNAETAIATDSKGRLWARLDGRRVRRQARARRALERGRDALRRAGRRRRGQERALDVLARRQRDRVGALDVLAAVRRRQRARAASTYVTRVLPGLTLTAEAVGQA